MSDSTDLISCPVCKKSVSSFAPTCPHCGQPTPGAVPMRSGRMAKITVGQMLGAMVVVIIAIVIFEYIYMA